MIKIRKYIDRIIYPEAARIQADIRNSGGSVEFINKLGVLYARYGLMVEAEGKFKEALLRNQSYFPALLNLGNIQFLEGDIDTALTYFEKAYDIEPANSRVVLSIARANHRLENYGTVKKYFNKLVSLDSDLASKFSYLRIRGEEATRAAEAGALNIDVMWMDE